MKKIIVYLKLDPNMAKKLNLPVKLPILIEDFEKLDPNSPIPLDIILNGLEAQYRIKPDDEYYKSYLIYFYYEMVKKKIKDEKFDEAFEYLKKAKKLHYDHRYHFYTGILLKKMGKYDEAEIELRKSIGMKKDFSYGYFELGNLMYAKKEYDEALKMYMKAWEIEPTFLLSLLKIADLYMEVGDLKSAKDILLKLIENDESFSLAYARLGVIENTRQNFKRAVQYLKKAIELDPMNFDTRYNLSFSMMKCGDIFGAIEQLEEILRNDVKNAWILNEHSILCRNVGLYKKAVDSAQNAVELENKYEYKLTLARALSMIGEYDKATNILKEIAISENMEISILALKFLIRVCFEIKDLDTLKWSFNLLRKYNFWSSKDQAFENFVQNYRLQEVNRFEEYHVDLIDMAEYLLKSEFSKYLEKSTMRNLEYIIDTGGFNPTTLNKGKTDLIPFVCFVISKMNGNFVKMERELNKIAVAFHGSSETLACFRILIRLYEYLYLNEDFEIEDFMIEITPEVSDLNWYFMRDIVRKVENIGMDLEVVLGDIIKDEPKDLVDFIMDLMILSYFRRYNIVDKVKDEKLRESFKALIHG